MAQTTCDLAIARLKAAQQALSDRYGEDPRAPVNASLILTGAPTTSDLEAELEAANAEVDRVCVNNSPTG